MAVMAVVASTSTPGGVTATGRTIMSSIKPVDTVRGGAGARLCLGARPNVETAEGRLGVEIKDGGTPKALGPVTAIEEHIPVTRLTVPAVVMLKRATAIPASAGA